MNDRELLEMAAKAVGRRFNDYDPDPEYGLGWCGKNGNDWWNPLTDDGDALRLAVKLCLFTGAEFYYFRSLERFGGQDSDDLTATRRAIVRAAAEIGRRTDD